MVIRTVLVTLEAAARAMIQTVPNEQTIQKLDAQDRISLLLTFALLITLGSFLLLTIWIGARWVRRYARLDSHADQTAASKIHHDDWCEKAIVKSDFSSDVNEL